MHIHTTKQTTIHEHPSDVILDILRRESKKKTGLFRLDVPTGVGKSYAARNLIGQLMADPAFAHRKVIYLASQKKHLPTNEQIDEALRFAGLDKSASKSVLRVSSNFDMLNAIIGRHEISDVVPHQFAEEPSVKRLWSAVRDYGRMRQHGEDLSEDVGGAYYRVLSAAMRRFETEWRKRLAHAFEDDHGEGHTTSSQLLAIVKKDPKFTWIGRLYPSMYLNEVRACLLTYSKFLMPVHTLIDGSPVFYNHACVDNSLIIMDEIDMSKGDILSHITEQAARHRTDIPSLGATLCLSLMHSDLPEELFVGKDAERSRMRFADDARYAKQLYANASLRFEYKADESLTEPEALFFDGHRSIAINEARYVCVDTKNRIKRLSIDRKEGIPLLKDLGGIFSLVRRLRKHIFTLAASRRDARILVGESALEDEFRTILSCLDIRDDEQKRYLMEDFYNTRSRMRLGRATSAELQDSLDLSIYAHGLECINLSDSDNHAMSTEITVSRMGMTPESLMVSLIKRARVLGLSATATVNSPLCNYCEDYISVHCPEGIDGVRDEDLQRMRQSLERRLSAYGDGTVTIATKTLCTSGGPIGLAELVEGENQLEAGQYLYDLMTPSMTGDDGRDTYIRERYARFIEAYCYFLANHDMQSMLALCQATPKEDEHAAFSQAILKRLLAFVAQRAVDAGCIDTDLEQLDNVRFITDSRKFKKEYEEQIRLELEAGKRVFLIAGYPTIGTGVNLQYRSSGTFDVKRIDDLDMGDMRDFDGVYLDRPTHLAPYKPETNAERMRAIFEVCEIEECGEISQKLRTRAAKALAVGMEVKGLGNCQCVRARGSVVINQAIGRITRTNLKPRRVHILMDEGIAHRIDVHAMDGKLVNPEFETAMRALARIEDYAGTQEEEKANNKAIAMHKRIRAVLSAPRWTNEHIRLWRMWRDFALKYPTYCGEYPEREAVVRAGYIRANDGVSAYTYDDTSPHGEEFTDVKISLSANRRLSREVSDQAAQLPALTSIAEIRELFVQNNWPTQWKKSRYIMSPVFFRNIYLGALGEEIGRHLLEWHLPEWAIVDVEENEYFEKFDARIRGTSVFVDFKHWSGPVRQKRDEIEHIKGKMSAVGATHVLVCNLTNRGTAELDVDRAYGGRILQVPSLVDVSKGCVMHKNIMAIGRWLEKVAR